MTGALMKYDAACKALAAAKTVDVAKGIRDSAEAMRAYAKQVNNRDLEADSWEVRIRAERRIGELLAAQRATVGLNKGSRLVGKAVTRQDDKPKLKEVLGEAHKYIADRARKYAAVSLPEFDALLNEGRERILAEHKHIEANLVIAGTRAQTRAARRVAPPIPIGRFRLLYADPPWRYEHVETESRAIENQYPTMALEDICALDVPAADDSILFLWATSPKLAEAMQVIDSWRFNYRTCAIWDKQMIGMGYYFRQMHELLLVATRGSLPVPEPSNRPPSIIREARGRHSEKPEQVYELLERMYPDFDDSDRVELFARQARSGWVMWSNEPAEVINGEARRTAV